MKTLLKTACVVLALSGASFAVSAPASAAVSFGITLNPDVVGFAYADGYWDRDHHWHAWRNRTEARWYQTHYPTHYAKYRHDHDRKDHDHGWKNDHWWDNH